MSSFQGRDTKLNRFFGKYQHNQRKLLYFRIIQSADSSNIGHQFRIYGPKINPKAREIFVSVKLCSLTPPNLHFTLCPESSENIPIMFQETDLCFPKQNVPRNPKMGSKQSVVVPTQ